MCDESTTVIPVSVTALQHAGEELAPRQRIE